MGSSFTSHGNGIFKLLRVSRHYAELQVASRHINCIGLYVLSSHFLIDSLALRLPWRKHRTHTAEGYASFYNCFGLFQQYWFIIRSCKGYRKGRLFCITCTCAAGSKVLVHSFKQVRTDLYGHRRRFFCCKSLHERFCWLLPDSKFKPHYIFPVITSDRWIVYSQVDSTAIISLSIGWNLNMDIHFYTSTCCYLFWRGYCKCII